jgi:ankyrin repeat protein
MLLDHGAQVNLQTGTGATALFAAASRGHCQVVNMLLEHGADPLIKDKQGRSAFYYSKDYNVKAILTAHSNK